MHMSASKLRTGALMVAIGAAVLGHVVVAAAQQPNSLLELFNSIPKSPATLEEADKLIDWKGESSSSGTGPGISGGGLVAMPALKAGLAAHEAAVAKIVEASNAKINARMGVPTTAEQVGKGATAAGIDMARMQSDPAYAKEMQAKMKAMSPAELMAMSMAMQKGMGMGKGTVAVYDPPAVKAAAEAGKALLDPAQRAAITAPHDKRWAEVEKKKAGIDAKHLAKMPKRVLCDTDPSCGALMAQYVKTAMPLVVAHVTEVLKLETAALEEERVALAEELRKAEEMLKAAQYGALSQEPGNPTHVMIFDGYTSGRIRTLAVKLEEITKRAAHVGHCKSKPMAYFYQISECYE
jgi:hypothetical protein